MEDITLYTVQDIEGDDGTFYETLQEARQVAYKGNYERNPKAVIEHHFNWEDAELVETTNGLNHWPPNYLCLFEDQVSDA